MFISLFQRREQAIPAVIILFALTFFFISLLGSNQIFLMSLHIGLSSSALESAIMNSWAWALETATLITWGFVGKPWPAFTMFRITTGNSFPCACMTDNGVGASPKHGISATESSLVWAS